ncbi:hypothetical protein BSLG_004989 [Batrachochytrium salamandrivorans]|nr:hypothetical protein BSLG_004989 [Batrachochytrium salamandrivorans]
MDSSSSSTSPAAAFSRSTQRRLHPRFAVQADTLINDAKEKGNKLFASKLLKEAVAEYSKGLAFFVDPLDTAAVSEARPKRWSLGSKVSLSDLRRIVGRRMSSTSLRSSTPTNNNSSSNESSTNDTTATSALLPKSAPLSSPTSSTPTLPYETIDVPSPEYIQSKTLLATLLSNRSAAFSAINAFEDALMDAMAAVQWRPDWCKGHFRKAEALSGLQLYEDALEAYRAALALDPSSKTISERAVRTQSRIGDVTNGLLIHQIFPGRDICQRTLLNPVQNLVFDFAVKMRNFIYLVVNVDTKQCMVVDVCWDVDGVVNYAKSRGLEIVGAIVTHYHIDHVGGIPPPPYDSYGVRVDGLAKLLKKMPHIKAYAHELDIDAIIKGNPELSPTRFHPTQDETTIQLPLTTKGFPSPVSRVSPDSLITTIGTRITEFKFMHTPGHTPGSQCILVNGNRLFSGDTLFIGSCGRVDSPDSSKQDMFTSLQVRLAALADNVSVYPGHDYGGEITTIGIERAAGLLRKVDRQSFFGQFDC